MEENSIIRSEKKKKKKKRERIDAKMEEENNLILSEKNKKKKRKREEANIDVKMEIVPEQPEKIAPLVGYFPSGFDSQKGEPIVKVFRNKQRSNRLELVVSPQGSKVNFVGTSYTGEASAAQVCTYALGVLDKETQSLKIVPIASNKIFRLEPKFGESDSKIESPKKPLDEESVPDKSKKINELNVLYAPKIANTKAIKLNALNRKEDANTQKELEKKIQKVVINKEALQSAGAYTPRNIPPHDSNATEPENAYPLDRIILEGEWNSLVDVLECVQSGNSLAYDVYPSFVCNRAHKLMTIQDAMERDTLAGIFSYITHLVKFKDQRSVDHASSVKNHRVPSVLYQKFLRMFTDDGKFEPTGEKKDLLISYVLVLTLIADGFKTDPSDIAKDLRMTGLALRQYFLNLGCKLSRVEKVLTITLPLPLEFPKPKMERRKR